MHYHAEVWIPETDNLEQRIAFLMGPHRESEHTESGFWDWYQIGGRYTGAHGSYDPTEDLRNIETCSICLGTGFRTDALGQRQRSDMPSYTCNGCGTQVDGKWTHGKYGPGQTLKWPTQWVRAEIDVLPLTQISEELTAFTLIFNGDAMLKSVWNGTDIVDTDFDGKVMPALAKLGIKDGYLVTVDYHS